MGEVGSTVLWIVVAALALWGAWSALRRKKPARRGAQRATAFSDGSTQRTSAHTVTEIALPGRGGVRLSYAPGRDGRADAGEVVWAWVPYREDPTRGKDRPLLIVGREDAHHVLAMKLTSKSHDRDSDYLGIGSGAWDRQGRPSWIDIDQLYRVGDAGIRREASALPRDVFDRVGGVLVTRYGWIPAA